jgi:hypothetical protein
MRDVSPIPCTRGDRSIRVPVLLLSLSSTSKWFKYFPSHKNIESLKHQNYYRLHTFGLHAKGNVQSYDRP